MSDTRESLDFYSEYAEDTRAITRGLSDDIKELKKK